LYTPTGQPRGRPARIVAGKRTTPAKVRPKQSNFAPLRAAITAMLALTLAVPAPAPAAAAAAAATPTPTPTPAATPPAAATPTTTATATPAAAAATPSKKRKRTIVKEFLPKKPNIEAIKNAVNDAFEKECQKQHIAECTLHSFEMTLDGEEILVILEENSSLTKDDVEKVLLIIIIIMINNY
jgi:hypothetical protein